MLDIKKNASSIFISNELHVDSMKNDPFIAFSVSIKGEGIRQRIDKVYFKNGEGDWQLMPLDEHNENPNTWQSLLFLDKNLGTTKIKVEFSTIVQPNTVKLNFYFPEKTEDLLKKFNIEPKRSVLPQKVHTDCGCPRPETITRSTWCPDSSCYDNPNPVATDVKFLIVHHTAGSNVSSDWAAVVRAIWNYYVYTNGWDDIGYNFLVDPLGNIYEGRADDTRGAHFSGHNSETSGMALMGTYTSVTPPSDMLYTLEDLLVWKCCDKNIDPLATAYHASSGLTLQTISGHRDGGATECQGDRVYNLLPNIRTNVNAALSSCSLGIDNEFYKDISIYPNPFDDNVYLNYKNSTFANLEIRCFDVNGRLLYYGERTSYNGEGKLDLSKLESGIYFLRLSSENKTTTVKLIKR